MTIDQQRLWEGRQVDDNANMANMNAAIRPRWSDSS